jgi:UDP-N-acetylmuramoyl-L-alanyl-D-glutamate--2,6-diaminopimelate ligase
VIALRDLLDGMREPVADVMISGVSDDSRSVAPGDLFIAVAGAASDGHAHAAVAVAAGAVAVLAERPLPELSVPVLVVDDLKRRRGRIAARLYGNPAAELALVGITGTNGKTSIASYVAELAERLDPPAGYIGTIGWGRPGALEASSLTTESAIVIQRRLAALRDAGCRWVAMEVSSHALDQDRVAGCEFDYAVFSNLSRDHLDYHGDLVRYGEAKARLFRMPGLKAIVVNTDDALGRRLAEAAAPGVDVIGYGVAAPAALGWEDLEFHAGGVRGRLHTPWGDSAFELPLYGSFSVANAAAALAVLCHAGHELTEVVAGLAGLRSVPGRMEFFPGRPTIVVDYAHTPDALDKVLDALRPHVAGRLVCVCGCGGDRDRGKRPLMAQAAVQHADRVWLTSDNPRSEDPDAIIGEMLAGLDAGAGVMVDADRASAVRRAVCEAGPEDLVLVAGKGHEEYQEIAGRRLPFSDRELAAALTEKQSAGTGGRG